MYTLAACNVANGTMYDPYGVLAASAAAKAATDAATNTAAAAYNKLLCRLPSDFAPYGANVMQDVSDVNAATLCTPASPASAGGASSAGSAVSGGAVRGGSRARRPGGNCDVSGGGVQVVPLEGPNSGGLPQTSAQPARLTTPQGLPVGMGRYRGKRGGLGQCCTDTVAWGDAFPEGGPSLSVGQDVLNWIQAHPWLAVGIAAGGCLLVAGGRRG